MGARGGEFAVAFGIATQRNSKSYSMKSHRYHKSIAMQRRLQVNDDFAIPGWATAVPLKPRGFEREREVA